MAESLIADLFKTPADVRQEETDRLLEQGKASAEAYLTGAGQGGSPIAGAIRGLTATALQEMPLSMSQTVRRGMLGLSGGQVGASQAERQAAELNAVAKSATGRKPEEIRKAAERARAVGRGDIAMVLEERALKIEKNIDKITNKQIHVELLKEFDPRLAAAYAADEDGSFTTYFNAARDMKKGTAYAISDKLAAGALKAAYQDKGLDDPTSDEIARFQQALKRGDDFDEAVDKAMGGDGSSVANDPFAPK